jgi:hypothetical protein
MTMAEIVLHVNSFVMRIMKISMDCALWGQRTWRAKRSRGASKNKVKEINPFPSALTRADRFVPVCTQKHVR